MNAYQVKLVQARKRFEQSIDGDYIAVWKTNNWADRQRYTEAEAVVVGQMLLKGASELARRRMERDNND